jgi:hypothetical protein
LGQRFYDANLNRVEIHNVRQVADRAFFQRGKTWVDGRLLEKAKLEPSKTIQLGSDAYRELLTTLMRHGREATLSLRGEILLQVDGKIVRIINP